MASSKVKVLTDDTFESTISSGWTLVDFWAEWCAPCKALAPTIDELAEVYHGRIDVCKLDVDQHYQAPAKFGIRGIPTIILFKEGQQVDLFTGNSPQQIKAMVARHVLD